MKNKLKVLIAIVLVTSILITGCTILSNLADKIPGMGKDKAPKLGKGVVAIVDGTEISEKEYNKLLDYYLAELRAKHDLTDDVLNKDMGMGVTLLDSLKSDLLETMIVSEIIAKEAAKNNMKIDEAELQELYEENHVKSMEEDEEYKKIIEENKIDEDFIKNQMRKDLLGYQYKMFYLDKVEITDETAKIFYDENPKSFHSEEAKAKHIVVEDEKLAEDIIEKLEAGEDFETLAKKHSTEPAAQQTGGDLGYFSRYEENWDTQFLEAAFALEVGKVSQIKTDFGYHVIIVEDKTEESIKFEDAKETIKSSLKESDYQNHIVEILEKANIVKKEDL